LLGVIKTKWPHEGGKLEEFREQLGREIMRHSCKPNLRQIVMRMGHQQLWMLEAKLKDLAEDATVDTKSQVA